MFPEPALGDPAPIESVPAEAAPAEALPSGPWTAELALPTPGRFEQVVDADVDLHDPAQRAEIRPHELVLLGTIAVGGILGAEARYGLGAAVPDHAARFPWTTLLINVTGCLLIGVLMVLVLEVLTPHRLLRPFLGVGVLGGFTTFSTFSVDAIRLVRADHPLTALLYVGASVLACLLAVWAATAATARLFIGRLR